MPRSRNRATMPGSASRTSVMSILVTTTRSGRRHRAGSKASSSRRMASYLSRGSRPSLGSTRCSSSRVRSTCFRNRMPRPAPVWAPLISPGMSATTKLLSSAHRTTPRFGTRVVNG